MPLVLSWFLKAAEGRGWLSEQLSAYQPVGLCRQMAVWAYSWPWKWIRNCRSVMWQNGPPLPAKTHGTSNINRHKHSSVLPWQEQPFGLSHRPPLHPPAPHPPAPHPTAVFSLFSAVLSLSVSISQEPSWTVAQQALEKPFHSNSKRQISNGVEAWGGD